MRPVSIITALLVGGLAFAAHADDFTCKGQGKCVCTETIAPASVLGYNSTDDHQSVNVNIVCINQDTMQVSYYQRRKEQGLGGSYTSVPVPHN
ncbi:MAG TPA: hypothetical protein VKV77_14310 [Methylovirgula sp.]|nr:hypothetical protein [Methylovirgula sp.]